MKFASVRDLKNSTSEMIRIAQKGKDVLITSHGKPVALLHGISEEDLEDWILSQHADLRESIDKASRHYTQHGGLSLDEVMKKLKQPRKKGPSRGGIRR